MMISNIQYMKTLFRKVSKIKVEHIGCSVLMVGMFALAFDYVRLHQEFNSFKRQYQESITLAQKVKDIEVSMASVDKILSQLNGFSSKLQMIARIPQRTFGSRVAKRTPSRLDTQVATKPVSGIIDGVPYKELREKIDLDTIELKLDDLRSEAVKQERSLADLEGFYSENNTLLASIPTVRPSRARITSAFGFRKNPNGRWQMHEGMDFAANYGTGVVSPADGLVEKVAYSPSYGRYIVIDHGYGLKSKFAHTSRILVRPGQYVKRGKRIALAGNSGRARGTHLHYEVRLNDVPVDPRDYMFN